MVFIVYPDGTVCISILVNNDNLMSTVQHHQLNANIVFKHPPGDDKYGYEKASERWSPVHTVETILVSVISMLSSPNDESPANIEAAVGYFFCLSRALNFMINLYHFYRKSGVTITQPSRRRFSALSGGLQRCYDEVENRSNSVIVFDKKLRRCLSNSLR